MKVVALLSGGKDSCFNMMQCVANGHQIIALANLKPKQGQDEMDSFMYQTVGHDAIELYSECMDLPLYRREISGQSTVQDMTYSPTLHDEVEDLYALLVQVKNHHPDVEAVSVGAILSNYQRIRVENVCVRLNLTPLAYLWRRDQEQLLDEMIDCGLEAILIKVAAMGLNKSHLGKTLHDMRDHLHMMNKQYDAHVCGEGGEFESLTLDCPLFKKRIIIEEAEPIVHSDDAVAVVAYLRIKKAHTHIKPLKDVGLNQQLVSCLLQSSNIHLIQPTDITLKQVDLKPNVVDSISNNACTFWHNKEYFIASNLSCSQFSSLESETHDVMKTLENELTNAGYTWNDVILMTVYVRDMSMFGQLNQVYASFFSINPPPRVTIQAHLPYKNNIQVDCIAFKSPHFKRNTMHVQGISYWAPANIGPYSQATQVADQIYFAGQIGLIPATMTLPRADNELQELILETNYSFHHVLAAVEAMHSHLSYCVSCICFVSKPGYLDVVQRFLTQTDYSDLPILFVSVPGLPRGAKVEWQVMCVEKRPRVLLNRLKLKEDDVDLITWPSNTLCNTTLKHSVHYTRRCRHQSSLMGIHVSGKPEQTGLAQCMHVLLDAANDFIQSDSTDIHVNWQDVVMMRVFYTASKVSLVELKQVFESVMTQYHNQVVPSWIPVEAMLDDHIVGVSVLLSTLS